MPDLRAIVRTTVNHLVAPLGVSVVSHAQLQGMRQRIERLAAPLAATAVRELPAGAAEYLRADNPRLTELHSRYRAFASPATAHSLWNKAHRAQIDLKYFRGDNPYIYQVRDDNRELHYLLTAFYLKSIDTLGLFGRLDEDHLFGVHAVDCGNGWLVSRDLLDSISEILFLEEAIGISQIPRLRVLDIGAGYGRMGYRLARALPNLERMFCTDAVAESSFLCEYYLNFRGVAATATAVPLDEIGNAIAPNTIHLAMNIHSFSECSLPAVNWWLDLVANNRVRYLLIVPNAGASENSLRTTEGGKPGRDFFPEIISRGYRLLKRRPKYCSPALQKYGITPAYYYLFELAL